MIVARCIYYYSIIAIYQLIIASTIAYMLLDLSVDECESVI